MRSLPVFFALLLAACPASEVKVPEASAVETLEATVEIDPASSAKRFQGVWLVKDSGTRLLIAYRNDPLWAGFVGKRVTAEIERYTPPPEVQSISAPHARVLKIEAEAELQTPLIEVGPEETLVGELREMGGEPGTKGGPYQVLVLEGGGELMLANAFERAPGPVKLRGRRVVRSPFVAHRGGAYVWVSGLETGS